MRMTDERAGTSSYVELHRMLFNLTACTRRAG